MHKVAGSNPAGNKHIFRHLSVFLLLLTLMTHIEEVGSYGVMVSTLDFESSDPSSNLDRTSESKKSISLLAGYELFTFSHFSSETSQELRMLSRSLSVY